MGRAYVRKLDRGGGWLVHWAERIAVEQVTFSKKEPRTCGALAYAIHSGLSMYLASDRATLPSAALFI